MEKEITIAEEVRCIKRSFRLMMNGVTSMSMREKGANYKLNWGATLAMLKNKANEIGNNYELAIALWKENVRECKILAIMIMPHNMMTSKLADEWMEQSLTQEIVELSSFYLYQYIDDAKLKAVEWISSENELYQVAGYNILSRLFMNNTILNEDEVIRFITMLAKALQEGSFMVRKAAFLCSQHFSDLGSEFEDKIKVVHNQLNLDFF
jgi:hypothetical protein